MDGFKPSTKNRLDFIPDGFFPSMDGLKPSRNGVFFVVIGPQLKLHFLILRMPLFSEPLIFTFLFFK
jgi:hypothetical protein